MSKKTIRNLIIASTFLLVAIAGFIYMVLVIRAEGNLLREQISTLSSQRAQEDAFYRLQRIDEESSADRAMLTSYFLEKDKTIYFLNQIEEIAPRVGVTFASNAHKLDTVTEKATGAQWFEVGLSFSGSEENVERFIQVLENLPYLLKVTNLELAAQSSTLWKADVTIQVFLQSYDK